MTSLCDTVSRDRERGIPQNKSFKGIKTSRNRLLYVFVALALLVIAGSTIHLAMSTIELMSQVSATLTLNDADSVPPPSSRSMAVTRAQETLENAQVVPPKQPGQQQQYDGTFANQVWLIGLTIIVVITLAIAWMLFRRNSRDTRKR